MGNGPAKVCHVCHSPQRSLKLCQCCSSLTCEKCFDFPVIKPQKNGFDLASIDYFSACQSCFLEKTSLNFETSFEIVGDANEKEIIFLHGAGSSRKMFLPHAKKLAQLGYRSILIDLPGHGARYKEDLTLSNCISAIQEAKNECKSKDITIIGGSLGGYILMEALGEDKELCKRAIIMMSGQNVGVNRGMLASLGLWAMGKACNFFSQADIAKKFMQAAAKNTNLQPKMIEQLSTCSVFFKHSDQNITLLKQTNPSESLTQGKVKCLFINGSQDHRDSQNIWLQAAGKGSRLLVYEGADHFFTHDKRFYSRLIEDVDKFITQA